MFFQRIKDKENWKAYIKGSKHTYKTQNVEEGI